MCDAADHLRELLDALPAGASVTLQRETLEDWLEEAESKRTEDGNRIAPLTVQEVAEELGRSPSCIRGWLGSGELDGFKLNGREWRVPREAVREFMDRQRDEAGPARGRVPSRRTGELSEWRGEKADSEGGGDVP